jgi:polyisoprenoid-binding protein YceI
MKRLILFFLFNCLLISFSFTQVSYKVDEGSTMTITGTSTLHDWTSKVNEINGDFVFNNDIQNKKLPKSGSIVEQIKMVIPVLSIESPRGSTMDKKTYNALKSEENPNMVFEVKSDNIESIIDKSAEKFLLKVTGDLTLAGYTKEITIDLEGQKLPSGQLKFLGAYPIDMVEYEIEPPSAMFGQIKTGKDVVIDFDLLLSEN